MQDSVHLHMHMQDMRGNITAHLFMHGLCDPQLLVPLHTHADVFRICAYAGCRRLGSQGPGQEPCQRQGCSCQSQGQGCPCQGEKPSRTKRWKKCRAIQEGSTVTCTVELCNSMREKSERERERGSGNIHRASLPAHACMCMHVTCMKATMPAGAKKRPAATAKPAWQLRARPTGCPKCAWGVPGCTPSCWKKRNGKA